MSLQDLGAIGEFLGSLIVLITLIYIAIQTRESRSIATAESTRALHSEFVRISSALKDKEIVRLVRIGLKDWKELAPNDQARIHVQFLEYLLHYGNALEEEDMLGAELLTTFENNLLGIIGTPGGREWWEVMKQGVPEKVSVRLENRLADKSSLPRLGPRWCRGTTTIMNLKVHNMKFKPVAFAPSDRHNCHLNCKRNFSASSVGGLTWCYVAEAML